MAFERSFVPLSFLHKKYADYAITIRLYESELGRGDATRLWRLQDEGRHSFSNEGTRCIAPMIERVGSWEAISSMIGVTYAQGRQL